jgi:predicted TIM-barrel fold metal-dependent hydrolase
MRSIERTEHDRLIYEQEIRPWIPEQVFDAHAHLIANRFHPRLKETMPMACDPMLGEVDCAYLQEWWRALLPDSFVSGMLMGFPTIDVEMARENTYVAEQSTAAGYPFALLTHPETPTADLREEIKRLRPSVLKPYLVFAQNGDTSLAAITDFIPESQLALADEFGLAVMLHVSKPRGMADANNLADIARLLRDFPNCHFILAHCGRCFIPPNMETMLEQLPVAENLWLDTSAVCDLGAFLELLNRYDRSRILFGTDLVTATAFRGNYIRMGMSWHACTAKMVTRAGGMPDKTTFAAYENLAALCRAMRLCACGEEDRQSIFYHNACGLFGCSGEKQ